MKILGLVELMCLGFNIYILVKSTLNSLLICFQDFILPGHFIGVHTIIGLTLNYCNLFFPFPIYSDFWGNFFSYTFFKEKRYILNVNCRKKKREPPHFLLWGLIVSIVFRYRLGEKVMNFDKLRQNCIAILGGVYSLLPVYGSI